MSENKKALSVLDTRKTKNFTCCNFVYFKADHMSYHYCKKYIESCILKPKAIILGPINLYIYGF